MATAKFQAFVAAGADNKLKVDDPVTAVPGIGASMEVRVLLGSDARALVLTRACASRTLLPAGQAARARRGQGARRGFAARRPQAVR